MKITWAEEEKKIVREIETQILKQITHAHVDLNKSFELFSDPSNYAIAAHLKQGNEFIAFYSHKLQNSELNYSVVEKEFFAIAKAFDKFRIYLLFSTHRSKYR